MSSQLVHILQLVVKHYKVYYPVRHHLIQHVVSSIQRLGFTATATIEQKKLAVDLCEIVIKWEMQRIREENEGDSSSVPSPGTKHQVSIFKQLSSSLEKRLNKLVYDPS